MLGFYLVFLFIYLVFFMLDLTTGLHFYDFLEVGIFGMVFLVYFFISYVNVVSSSSWFFVSYFGSFSSMGFSYLNLFSTVAFSFYNFGSVYSNSVFNHLFLSIYHVIFVSFYFSSVCFFYYFSYFSFFFSDGLDFLYSSYSSSTLWLFCVFLFCVFFVWSVFTCFFGSFTSFSFFFLKSHFLLEFNAFFSVVFYVMGLFFFCLLGLVVWFSLFYDNYGVFSELFGSQWFWGETVGDIYLEWKTSSLISVDDLHFSQSSLLTTISPFLFDVNVHYCVNLSSLDVIHSFGLPKFGIKIDVMPGVVSHVSFFSIFPSLVNLICSELCGAKHSQMYSEIVFG